MIIMQMLSRFLITRCKWIRFVLGIKYDSYSYCYVMSVLKRERSLLNTNLMIFKSLTFLFYTNNTKFVSFKLNNSLIRSLFYIIIEHEIRGRWKKNVAYVLDFMGHDKWIYKNCYGCAWDRLKILPSPKVRLR